MRRQATIPPFSFCCHLVRLTARRQSEPVSCQPRPQPRVLAAACPQVINRATRAVNLPRCRTPAPFHLPQLEPVPTLPTCCHLLPNPFYCPVPGSRGATPVSYRIESRARAPTLLRPAHSEPITIPHHFPHHMTTPNLPNVDIPSMLHQRGNNGTTLKRSSKCTTLR